MLSDADRRGGRRRARPALARYAAGRQPTPASRARLRRHRRDRQNRSRHRPAHERKARNRRGRASTKWTAGCFERLSTLTKAARSASKRSPPRSPSRATPSKTSTSLIFCRWACSDERLAAASRRRKAYLHLGRPPNDTGGEGLARFTFLMAPIGGILRIVPKGAPVLVVDDDGITRRLLCEALGAADIESVGVGSGGEALQWLSQANPGARADRSGDARSRMDTSSCAPSARGPRFGTRPSS